MCDYSLQHVASRPAKVGDKLVTHAFGSGTSGFAAVGEVAAGDVPVAVCCLPGTEIAFDEPPRKRWAGWFSKFDKVSTHKIATFRQINKDELHIHHDAVEFPDGRIVLLNALESGRKAFVLQLPAAPKTEQEAKEQERLPVTA